MAFIEDIDGLLVKKICYHCVGERYLSGEIRSNGKKGACSYCGKKALSYTMEEISERIEIAFEQHYRRTSDQPDLWQQSLLADRESDYDWERDGEPVLWAIQGAAEIPEQAADDVLEILDNKYSDLDSAAMGEECEFDPDSYYEYVGQSDQNWREKWANFARSLKTESRFFSRSSAEHLASLFANVDKMNTADGRPLVIDAGPLTNLTTVYRARVFQSEGIIGDRPRFCFYNVIIGDRPRFSVLFV